MSKHQSCMNCRSDFVGPDSNIGNKLCPDCDNQPWVEDKITELRAENASLRRTLFNIAEYRRLNSSTVNVNWASVSQSMANMANVALIGKKANEWICPDCGVKLTGTSYPKLHTCKKDASDNKGE